MAIVKVGDRVGAIQCSDSNSVNFFGYGVYDGYFEHPELGFANPRITLDDGRIVWGCECWWGDAEKIRNRIGNKKIVMV